MRAKEARTINLFRARLLHWRQQNDYTQESVAALLNISVRCVQNWEEGSRLPNFDSLLLLSEIMGVSIDWLCGKSQHWQTLDHYLHQQGISFPAVGNK